MNLQLDARSASWGLAGNLDPAARKFLDMIGAATASDLARTSPAEMRERFRRLMMLVGGQKEDVRRIDDGELPGAAGPLPIRVYTPRGQDGGRLPGLVYFHGGGGIFGSIETHDGLCRMLANASGCRVISVDYRLAPEYPFPAAAYDTYAAVDAVFARSSSLAIDPDRIAVGGDSAGGGLAAAVCQRARAVKGPRIALQLLLCPVLDIARESESRCRLAEGYFLDRATIDWMIGHYCPRGFDPKDPRMSPLSTEDVAGQPPTHIHTAEFDPLCDEGRAYADRLQRAGTKVRYTDHRGMIHHFYGMTGAIPYARVAVDAIGAAVKEALT
jgi:acetyl esterase/lipase